ncbi:MAG: gamma carbonic anhydrase family protein [Spirochaetales bacterium]|nr:gamma carbonic anhydrase family protein [Spirochaetales bacterium]
MNDTVLKNIESVPEIDDAAYVAPSAVLTGAVTLGRDVSVWHGAVLRGDVNHIIIGDRSNVQDGAILHVAGTHPCMIGNDVTIGHGAIVHACEVRDGCLIGMGAIIMDGTVVEEECIIGAGAVIPGGKTIPRRSLVIGNPGKVVRQITDEEVEHLKKHAAAYVDLAHATRNQENRQ